MEHTAGEQLAMARQALGLSLDDVAARTRIRRDYLDAIEAMDLRDLPARTYVKGFLKTYAGVVGLDPAMVLEAFDADAAPERETVATAPRLYLVGAGRMRHWVIAGLVSVGLVFVIMSGLTPKRPEGMNVVPPVPEALYAWVDAEPGSPAGMRALAALSVAEGPRLTLRARIDTFLEVRDASGRRIFGGPLREGAVYTLPAAPGVSVSADNGGAIEILDGAEVIGVLGQAGVPVSGWDADELRALGGTS